jgi:hypothetical protein
MAKTLQEAVAVREGGRVQIVHALIAIGHRRRPA